MELLRSISEYVKVLGKGQYVPQQKFIYDMLVGIIRGQSPMLSHIVRALDEKLDIMATEKRLSRNLNSDRLDEEQLRKNYLEEISPYLKANNGAGIRIGVDYTDLSRRFGDLRPDRGSEYLARCWDGSEGKPSPGYPIVQFEGILPDGVCLPIAYYLYSALSPVFVSQNKEFETTLREVWPYFGALVFLAFDRAFISQRWCALLDEIGVRNWVGRLRVSTEENPDTAECMLALADGRFLRTYEAACETTERFKYTINTGKRKSKHVEQMTLSVGTRKVWFVDGPADTRNRTKWNKTGSEKTLIVIWGFGKDPMALMTSGWRTTKKQIMEAIWAYRGRWTTTEESSRVMKDKLGWGLALETARALRLQGLRRIMLLVSLAYGFLALQRLRHPAITAVLAKAAKAFGTQPKDPRYRIMAGMSATLNKVRRYIVDIWRTNTVKKE